MEPISAEQARQILERPETATPGMLERARTRRPTTVFPSMMDWLDEDVPIETFVQFLQLIHETPNLRWLLLTKRPENWRERLELVAGHLDETDIEGAKTGGLYVFVQNWLGNMGGTPGFRPPTVWVGTSIEDQTRADQRIPALLGIPAVGRFLSVEPLLGPVDLEPFMQHGRDTTDEGYSRLDGIHWVIIGGESGPRARPCNVEWIRSLVRQCKDAAVSCFVKQVGSNPVVTITRGQAMPDDFRAFSHPKGGDPAEWPADLRVREFPEGLR